MASNRTPALVLLVAAVAAGVTVFVVKQRDGAPGEDAPPAASSAAATPAPTAADETTQVVLGQGRVVSPGAAAAASKTPEELAAQRAEADVRIHQALARMDAEFLQQPAGGGMAAVQGRAQALLSDPMLAQAIARPTTSAFECRARQCRLSAEFAPGAPPDDWLMRLNTAGTPIFSGGQIGRVRLPDGRTQVRAYFNGATPAPSAPSKPFKPQNP